MKDRINKGDIVNVNINNAQITLAHRAEVLWIPQEIGEDWIFKNLDNDNIIYISEGCTIIKEASNETD